MINYNDKTRISQQRNDLELDSTHTSLTKRDVKELRDSGIVDQIIEKRGYCSSDGSSEDQDQLERAGYEKNQQVSGLMIPFWGYEGDKDDYKLQEEPIFSQLKPYNPRCHSDNPDKVIKYESPKNSKLILDTLHCPPDIDANENLYVVEGIKKADALYSHNGGYIIGIVGCWGWRNKDGSVKYPLSEYIKKNRDVYLILDADIGSNEQVKSSARAFFKACKKEKARPKILNLSAVAKGTEGIDDFLVSGGRFLDIPTFSEEEVEEAVGLVHDKDTPTIEECLKDLGLSFRTEIRGGKQEIKYEGKETQDVRTEWREWETFNRPDVCSISTIIQTNFRLSTGENKSKRLTVGRDKLRDMLHAYCNDNKIDPMQEYLEGLPIWDTKPRIDFVLQHLFDVEDTKLNKWSSSYTFIGTVERMFEPGVLHRAIPILKGPESLGKSEFLRQVLPPNLQIGGLSDQVDLNDNAQRQCEQLQGAIIVELAELAGMRKADIEHLKSFITRRTDKIRMAYQDQVVETLRRFVLYGTTNDEQPLPNVEGGNTRFVVVECRKGCDVAKYMNKNRDQLWAEALNRYRRGEKGQFPRELMGIQKEENEKYRSRNELIEDAVANWCKGVREQVKKDEKRRGPHPLQEVANAAGVDNPTRSVQLEIGQALRAEGFEKKKGNQNGWWLKK